MLFKCARSSAALLCATLCASLGEGIIIHVPSSEAKTLPEAVDILRRRQSLLLPEQHEIVLHDSVVHQPVDLRDFGSSDDGARLTIRAADGEAPVVSGGCPISASKFKPDESRSGVLVASLAGIKGLEAHNLGTMVEGGCVGDCQHNKTWLSFDGNLMQLARWPNSVNLTSNGWQWAHATGGGLNSITLDTSAQARAPAWKAEIEAAGNESVAFVHGYWEWDWADCYRKVQVVDTTHSTISFQTTLPVTPKANARWYAVNLLSELDAPGEYFISLSDELLYFYPPVPLSGKAPVLSCMRNTSLAGAVIDASGSTGITLRGLTIRHGFTVGVRADHVQDFIMDNCSVSLSGNDGVSMLGSHDSVISRSFVSQTGCSGIRATGGNATVLHPGNVSVSGNSISGHAMWKRTYQPSIFWGGVSNTYRDNHVSNGPHNCFLGGGNEDTPSGFQGAGVNCTFEGNVLERCGFESADAGAFYTCGQQASAYVTRGNVIKNNTFKDVRNTVGTGVQTASVQAIYLDDQMSGWEIADNLFINCQVCDKRQLRHLSIPDTTLTPVQIGSFIGGGRDNIVRGNRYEHCDTAQHIDNRGLNWEKAACDCASSPACDPGGGNCGCNGAGARWVLANADPKFGKDGPFGSGLEEAATGVQRCFPFNNLIENNTASLARRVPLPRLLAKLMYTLLYL